MTIRKLQTAGGPEVIEYAHDTAATRSLVIYGAVAFGVIAGVVASAYWWKARGRNSAVDHTPLERVEELIASCENKIEDIERTIEGLKGSQD